MTLSKVNVYQKLRNKNGATLVEFALVAFLFFTVLFGIIEFGLVVYNQQVITNAGREGARYGIVARPEGYKIDKEAVKQVVKKYAENHIVSFGEKNFIPDPRFIDPITKVEYEYCRKFQDVLTVDVTYDYSFLFLPFAKKTLGTKAVMICE